MPRDLHDQAICAIARALYRMDEGELLRAEADLQRLLQLSRHYRQHLDGAVLRDGAAHLQVGESTGPPKP